MRIVCIFLIWVFGSVPLLANGLPLELINRAERAYFQKDFETAFLSLSAIPGLLGVVPMLDHPKDQTRAEIFFDLARIRLAQKDTARARAILSYVFVLDGDARQGVLDIGQDEAYIETRKRLDRLRMQKRQKELSETTFWGAAGRSLILPGWGHIYRGHHKRAYVFAGVTAAATLYWFVADRAYKTAYNAYRSTQIGELDVNQRKGEPTDPFPFRQRFENAQAKASRANMALGILAGVWLANVFDHVVVGPAYLEVSIPIF